MKSKRELCTFFCCTCARLRFATRAAGSEPRCPCFPSMRGSFDAPAIADAAVPASALLPVAMVAVVFEVDIVIEVGWPGRTARALSGSQELSTEREATAALRQK